jgi:hypothetical protein
MSGAARPRKAAVQAILTGPVLEHMEASRRGLPFVGGPLPAAELQEAADVVARLYRLDALMQRIASGVASVNEVHTLVMSVWAGGFKAGAEHAS